MPADRSNAEILKVGIGHFELALLECLVKTTGGSFAKHIRNAIRYYARNTPAMNPEWVAEYVEKKFRNQRIPPGESIDLRFALKRFLEDWDRPPEDGWGDVLDINVRSLKVTAADFVDPE